jgi:hypothetical protein
MLMALFCLLIIIGSSVAALAQFIDKGKYVEVKKKAMLYSNIKMEKAKGAPSASAINFKTRWRSSTASRSLCASIFWCLQRGSFRKAMSSIGGIPPQAEGCVRAVRMITSGCPWQPVAMC